MTLLPMTLPVRLSGGDRTTHGLAPPATTNCASLDGALAPALFTARTRTKYVPDGTLNTASDVAALPVSKFAMLANPAAEPASITYDAGGSPPAGAVQASVTTVPLAVAVNPVGGPGATTGAAVAEARRMIVVCAAHPATPNAAW